MAPVAGTTTNMATRATSMAEPAGALPLLLWFSPAFPVGAFAYSHGLEWAVEEGSVRDAASLQGWIGDLLAHGAARNDAILFANAWRAAGRGDAVALAEVNALALALAGSRERLLETTGQGNAFVAAARAAWPCAALGLLDSRQSDMSDDLATHATGTLSRVAGEGREGAAQDGQKRMSATAPSVSLRSTSPPLRGREIAHDLSTSFQKHTTDIAYPVAAAVTCAGHGIALASALDAFVLAFAANLVSATVRLGPIGQSDGQRVLAALLPEVTALAIEAATAPLDDIGDCAFMSDIASMRHETQYSRLFRS